MSVTQLALWFVLPLLALGILLAFLRLLRGPSLPDRVVALDVMSSLAIGFIACYAVGRNQPVYLDVAVVLALLAFLGTVAFAYYLERRVRR
jgi:multicomponent Na+:H+ antiporter subunit F